ncbi:PDDEXK family nuclease [Tepidimicrobium xylanilyticum]
MAINSKRKGKNGELEFSNLCKKHGFNTRRSQQYAGIHGDADVVGLDGIHIEVKRVERLNIEQALQQAERDKKEREIPIVAHRRNREEWKITMRAKDWFEFYKAWRDSVEGMEEMDC